MGPYTLRVCRQHLYCQFLTLYIIPFFTKVCRRKHVCVCVCVCMRLLGEKSTNNKIMRSSKYSSRWPEQGGVLIEMILGRARLRTFTQIHTQVLSACNIMAPSVRCVMELLLQTAFKESNKTCNFDQKVRNTHQNASLGQPSATA